MKPRTFNARELLEQADDFERVVKASEKYCDLKSRLSRLLCALFAMKSAFLIHTSLGPTDDVGELATAGFGDAWESIEQRGLPSLDTVHSAVQKLRGAVASNSRCAVISALEDMGVFALCPIPDQQLWRMERLAGNVSGRARLVFWVELALFAGELRNFDAVRKYVSEAWILVPSGWELYNLCIFEGLFALEAGNPEKALEFLERAVRACQTDEHTLISCGLRPPNFLLAQRLLERGAYGPVLTHLMECKTVWQRRRLPIDNWISLIENKQMPDFDDCESVKGISMPSCRVDLQWRRARALANAKDPGPASLAARSLAEVVAAREKLLAEVDHHISANVKDTISYLDKGLEAPPSTPSANPEAPKPE